MNKRALEEYALFARNELETQIALSLNKLGIYKDKIAKANIVGDLTVIEGTQETFPKRVYALRESILNNLKLKEEKFEQVVEEFAYTWFNRIIAIRFMEVHDYFDHGFRVLTSRDGSYEPEILKNIPFLIDELQLEADVVASLKDQNKIEELYRYLLFKQCNALNDILPELFDKEATYLELLLPNNLLSQDSVIRKILIIPEEDFKNDVEIVGWLYQFYVASNREEFRKAKVVTKDLIPTLSQIFTPDWIVRYMAENSVGRIWVESYPNTGLKDEMKYFIEECEQSPEIFERIEAVKYKNVDPKDIKILEPCCGSGHILVYVFDLLFKMYLEANYNKKDIPGLILKNNLFGLDIDKRASQLAKFALIMRARSIDNRFFNADRFVKPRVFEIIDSTVLLESNYYENMKSLHFTNKSIKIAEYLVDTFKNAKTIGSLLKVEHKDYKALMDEIKICKTNETPNLLEQDFFYSGLKVLSDLIKLAITMTRKYDVMITNPPYLESGKFQEIEKKYYSNEYPNSKTDLFSMFMDTGFVKENGFQALVNPDNWMFLVSFKKLRKCILDEKYIVNMLHLGMGVFDAVVQATSFVIRNTKCDSYNSLYFRYVENKNVTDKISLFEQRANCFIKQGKYLSAVPGSLFAYWISDSILNVYKRTTSLNFYADVCQGLAASGNDKFLRLWYEVESNKTCLIEDSNFDYWKATESFKWFPHSKGGEVKKWYGNEDYVINYANKGYDVSHNKGSVIRNDSFYFKRAISWSDISSSNISFRYKAPGHVFDAAGPSIFVENDNDFYYLFGLLNSNVIQKISKFVSPALHFSVGQVAEYPIVNCDVITKSSIAELSKECINITKYEWDNYETSWNFKKNPMINSCVKLTDSYEQLKNSNDANFERLVECETKLNSLIISAYGLNDEIEDNVSRNDITIKYVNKNNSIIHLISYLVGCIMGRYSLEQEGLVYAGGNFDKSKYGDYVDDDGIIPIYSFVGIEDGLTKGICDLIKKIYGDTYYKENLDFIADALNRKSNEGAEEAINRYLNDDFYNDHVKMYQKRPIYWMLSSGKQGAFKCLVYLHRYNKNTLAAINSKYFLPRTAMYKAERERVEFKLQTADIRDKRKYEQELAKIETCEQELLEYGQVLDHMANQFIDIDLDDGVKVNYVKFQGVSLEVNGANIKKNLLVPFGLEEKKK